MKNWKLCSIPRRKAHWAAEWDSLSDQKEGFLRVISEHRLVVGQGSTLEKPDRLKQRLCRIQEFHWSRVQMERVALTRNPKAYIRSWAGKDSMVLKLEWSHGGSWGEIKRKEPWNPGYTLTHSCGIGRFSRFPTVAFGMKYWCPAIEA